MTTPKPRNATPPREKRAIPEAMSGLNNASTTTSPRAGPPSRLLQLLELRAQLLNNADDTGQHLRENEITTDPSDRATLEEEYTLELRTRDRERKLLKKVEKSLRMIDDGSYGYCEETGEPIGIPRLLARPTATLSLEAQERRERVQKLYGD